MSKGLISQQQCWTSVKLLENEEQNLEARIQNILEKFRLLRLPFNATDFERRCSKQSHLHDVFKCPQTYIRSNIAHYMNTITKLSYTFFLSLINCIMQLCSHFTDVVLLCPWSVSTFFFILCAFLVPNCKILAFFSKRNIQLHKL